MTGMTYATLATALAVKHYLADYIFNPAFLPTDKHIYGSKGSFGHLGMHMFWCMMLLIWFLPIHIVILAALFDGFVHYHQDYFKTKFLRNNKDLSERARRAVIGGDQLVHILTYIIIVAAVG